MNTQPSLAMPKNQGPSLDCDSPVIHIGYHKTGTSYLQSKFFIAQRGYSRWPADQAAIHPVLIDMGPFEVLSNINRQVLQDSIDDAKARNLRWVCSHERLSGHPSSGGYDSKILADRMHLLLPNAKVLIIIREQRAMIRSAYSQFITEGGSLSLGKYLRDPQAPIRKVPLFSLKHFEYAPLISYYQSLFGASQVLALPYELFSSNPVDFLNRVGEFSLDSQHVPITEESYQREWVNRRFSVVTQFIRRQLNATCIRSQFSNGGYVNLPNLARAFRYVDDVFDRIVPRFFDNYLVERQKKVIEKFVGNYYTEFNRETSQLLGFDLQKFGYK